MTTTFKKTKMVREITFPEAGDISYSISSSQLIICMAHCPSAVSPTES